MALPGISGQRAVVLWHKGSYVVPGCLSRCARFPSTLLALFQAKATALLVGVTSAGQHVPYAISYPRDLKAGIVTDGCRRCVSTHQGEFLTSLK